MPLFDHFQLLAPIYDKVIKISELENLIELADLPTSGFLLDAGGGTGRISNGLQNQASKVVVADLSLNMLIQARKKGMLDTVCSRTEGLPFPDNFFDRIIMVDALHHVYNQEMTANDLWRVLKPGGRIVIEEPDINDYRVKFVAVIEKFALMRSRFLSPSKIVSLFDFPEADTRLVSDDYNSWIVVKKL